MHEGYFEGTLQLRDAPRNVVAFVYSYVEKHDDIDIAKEVHLKNGIDFYISFQKALQKLGKSLQRTFGGQLVITRKLFSQNRLTSKSVYRLTVLFRPCSVKRGQIITYKGEKYKVVLIGNKVGLKNVESGKRLTLNHDQLT